MKPIYITFTGGCHSGKTTSIQIIKKILEEKGKTVYIFSEIIRNHNIGSIDEIRSDANKYIDLQYNIINEKIGGRTSLMYTDIIEIFIPIESVDGRIKTLIVEMDKKDNSIVSMRTSSTLFDKYINLERMLSKNYILHTIKGSYGIYIKSKEKPTNRTVIDLIDIFLAVVDNPVLEKIS